MLKAKRKLGRRVISYLLSLTLIFGTSFVVMPQMAYADYVNVSFNCFGTLIQQWTVPYTATYTITAAGAAGGSGSWSNTTTGSSGISAGGRGAVIRGDFALTKGHVIKILVGGMGSGTGGPGGGVAGGGGGSFIVDGTTNTVLLVAGGGGGAYFNNSGGDASVSTGTNTNGGSATPGISNRNGDYCYGGGGGGYTGNGSNSSLNTTIGAYGGLSYINGGLGGSSGGGFGGGGGYSSAIYAVGSGGGGGYSGGNGGYNSNGSGGTSYNSGTNPLGAAVNSGDGYVNIIGGVAPVTVSLPPPVLTVVQSVAFTKYIYGELSGGTVNGVTSTPASGSGYTKLTGNLGTVGPLTATFGGTMVLFNVIAAPTDSYTATVNFSS